MRRVAVLIAVLFTAGAGCGGKSDEQKVRDALSEFNAATASKDYRRLCRGLLASRLHTALDRAGVPCEAALRTGLADVQQPTLQVLRVRVRGDTARAVVRSGALGQAPLTATIELAKERGRWRVASLAQPGGAGEETTTSTTPTTPPRTTTTPPRTTATAPRTTTAPSSTTTAPTATAPSATTPPSRTTTTP